MADFPGEMGSNAHENSPKPPGVDPQYAISTNVINQQIDPYEDYDVIDFKEYWSILYRRRRLIWITLISVIVLVLVATFIQTPIYRATTLLQIEREASKVVEFEDANPVERSVDKDFYLTQYELLKSNSLAERVIADLNLQPKTNEEKMGIIDWVIHLFSSMDGNKDLAVTPSNIIKESQEKIKKTQSVLSSLTVEPVRNSRLVKVSFDHPDPQMAARIANAVAQAYISMNLEKKFEANAYAKTFLEERIREIKTKLEEAEKAQVEYAREQNIFSIDKEGGTTSGQNLQEFNVAMAKAVQERIKAEALYKQVYSAHNDDLPRELQSGLIQQLKSDRAKLEADYRDKSKTFKPGYPLMQELSARIQELTSQINKEVASIRASIKSSYEAAKNQEEMLQARLNASKGDILDLQNRTIQYNILKREADTNRQLYDGMLQRLKEVSVAGGIGTNNIMVVDKAEIPNGRYKPNIVLNTLIGFLIGLLAGIGLAFFVEHFDDTFKSGEDIERALGLPLLGIIPDEDLVNNHSDALAQLIDSSSKSAMAEAFRSARTALQFSTQDGAPHVLGVTSSHMSEGKSTVSLCLAINFTQCGNSVLLIDADLRKPSLHRAFNLDNQKGLTNHLAGISSVSDIIRETTIDGLYFISTGPLPPNPAELLQGTRMRELIADVKGKFDLVIFDGPPVLGLADALILGNAVDRLLFVIQAGTTERSVVKTAVKRLRMARVNPVGCILNKLGAKHLGYGYDYHYSYYAYGATPKKETWIKRLLQRFNH